MVNFGRVGDLVLAIPMLRHLAKSGSLDLLGRPWARFLLEGQSFIRNSPVLTKPYQGHRFLLNPWRGWQLHCMRRELASQRYDEVIVFGHESPEMRSWLKQWVPHDRIIDLPMTQPDYALHPLDLAERLLTRAHYDMSEYDPIPRLVVSTTLDRWAGHEVARLGKRILGIQSGSSLTHRLFRKQSNLKSLRPEQWGRFLDTALAQHVDAIVLLGSSYERREATRIRHLVSPKVRGRVHDWTGLSLPHLAAVLSHVSWLVSVDTGPAHLAAAVGCPLLVVFGPSNPAKWAPRGSGITDVLVGSAPCQFCMDTGMFKTCRSNVCLTTLPDEQIVSAFNHLVSRGGRLSAR